MVQRNPLSRDAVDLSEELQDTWRAAAADGVICAGEQATITPLIGQVQHIVLIVDTAQAAGLTILRRGLGGRYGGDRLNDLAALQDDPLTAA